jgi:hypothetical protein
MVNSRVLLLFGEPLAMLKGSGAAARKLSKQARGGPARVLVA